MEPQIRYCTASDGVSIAYTVTGSGPPLLYVRSVNHLALDWRLERNRRNYEWLARRHTLVRFDRRGEGLSQREGVDFSYALDIEAVVRELRLSQFAIFCQATAARWTVAYPHQEQVTRIVFWNGVASGATLMNDPRASALLGLVEKDWATFTETYAAVIEGWQDPAAARAYAALMRAATTADRMRQSMAAAFESDSSPLLAHVTAPALVVHVRESIVPIAAARALVTGMPNARLQSVEGESAAAPLYAPHIAPWLEAFLSGEDIGDQSVDDTARLPARSGVTTVLFTDLVGHTEMMRRLGDAKGREVLREHESITRGVLKAHAGAEVKTMGDGFMASFGSVTSAMDCAIALQQTFAAHDGEPLKVRVGLNAGEPIEEDGDLFGSTVIMASRIAAMAGAGEILIPEPLRHLLTGKSYVYTDRGEAMLKGFEDAVRLYEVRWHE